MPMMRQPLSVEHALLGLIREQPMHGYEIHQRLLASRELGLVWHIKQGLLYATLNRLEQDGLLAGVLEAQGSRPPRKILHLTAAGAKVFAEWLRQPVAHGRDFRIEFLVKLYFARQEGEGAVCLLIARQRQASTARLDLLKARAAALDDERGYDWLVLRYRIGQLEATLVWLEVCAEGVCR